MIDIDAEFRGNVFDWNQIEPRLYRLQEQPPLRPVVVDVGAGTQTLPQLYAFLRDKRALVVVATAAPEEVILRQPIADRPFADFVRTEYEERNELYSLATVTVDVTGLEKDAAARKIADLVRVVLADQLGTE